jgi:hypothetical protein
MLPEKAKEMQKQVDKPTPEGEKVLKERSKAEPQKIKNKKIKIIWQQHKQHGNKRIPLQAGAD